MLNFRWAKGMIKCTMLSFDGSTRNEERSIPFESGSKIPDMTFSQKECFRFLLKIKQEGKKGESTGVTSYRQEGELSFSVFLPGVQQASFSGSHVFPVQRQDMDPRTQEYSFTFTRVAVNQGVNGAVGFIKVELRFKLLA